MIQTTYDSDVKRNSFTRRTSTLSNDCDQVIKTIVTVKTFDKHLFTFYYITLKRNFTIIKKSK